MRAIANKLVDVTYGRRVRAVMIADSGHVILSAIQPETQPEIQNET